LALTLAGPNRKLGLVARRAAELAEVAAEVRRKGGHAEIEVCDAADVEAAESAWRALRDRLGGVDAIVYAAGVMPHVDADEFDTTKDSFMVAVNVVGAMAWLNAAARDFQRAGRGVICGVGSVAGDRGRRPSPAYGASKAALHTYLESLRNRLWLHGVRVVTIKPGPVDTPMTHGRGPTPLMVSADTAARRIADALEGGPEVVYVAWQWRYIMLVLQHIPSLLFRRFSK
jgi:short-subunit dehydrogenase